MKRQLQCLLAAATMAIAMPLVHIPPTTYFFTFGDSYTMTSFNVNSTQPSPSNPMGNPALGTGATGGGTNWVGYLATEYNSSLVLSYNLAIGGATIDNNLVNGEVEDMVTQVATFQSIYSSKPEIAPWTSSDAVFGFWIGINDVGRAFSVNESRVLVPKLMDKYGSLIEQIYADGGRRFLFLNVPPTSHSPFILDQGMGMSQKHAAWVTAYNYELRSMVERFRSAHDDAETVLYDTWSFMTEILDDPRRFGYLNATCINDDGVSCVWWNNYHPGWRYHELQAADMKKFLEPLGAW